MYEKCKKYGTSAGCPARQRRFWEEFSAHISRKTQKTQLWYPIFHCTRLFPCFSDQMFADSKYLPPIFLSFSGLVSVHFAPILSCGVAASRLYLYQCLSGVRGDHGLELPGGEGVHVAGLGGHEEHHLGPSQGRELVGLQQQARATD